MTTKRIKGIPRAVDTYRAAIRNQARIDRKIERLTAGENEQPTDRAKRLEARRALLAGYAPLSDKARYEHTRTTRRAF